MERNIDADKLLEKQFFSLDDDGFGMMVVAVTDIISAPTVERTGEHRKGRWIGVGRNYYATVSQCSECLAKYDFRSPYCPNCGADMRGDGDGK